MKIYVISDDELTPYNRLPDMLELAIISGCSMFQLRDKKHKDDEISSLCLELDSICKKHNIPFILNDRFELAIKLNLTGIHLGINDLSINFCDIRNNFDGIIGISCYGSIDMGLMYQNLGANYVAFGSIYSSNTKINANVVGIDILNLAKERINISVCAIGGINSSNIHNFKYTKLGDNDMIAMVSAIWVGNIKENIFNLKRQML